MVSTTSSWPGILAGPSEDALHEVRVCAEAHALQQIDMWSDDGDEPTLLGEHQQAQHTGHS